MASQIAARAPAGSLDGQALVPVPAHPRRRRRHGFNQAESIARSLRRITGLPVLSILARDGRVAPQVGLERRARLANARGSVRACSASVPARAVLVDDVYTTGATLDACARALSERGASEVVAVTFARAVRG
jgi:ComF family protein